MNENKMNCVVKWESDSFESDTVKHPVGSEKHSYFQEIAVSLIKELISSCNLVSRLKKLVIQIGRSRIDDLNIPEHMTEGFLIVRAEIVTDRSIVPFLWQVFKKNLIPTDHTVSISKCLNEEMKAAISATSMPESSEIDLILEPWLASQFVHEIVGHSLEADNFLKYVVPEELDIGSRISSYPITIVDCPDRAQSRVYFQYDDEQNTAKSVILVKNGILNDVLTDCDTATQLGSKSNGHGRKASSNEKILPRMSNTILEPGILSPLELISNIEYGMFCVGTWGGGSQGSQFILRPTYGRIIRNGEVTDTYIRRFDILGNKFETLLKLDGCANDMIFHQPFFGCQKESNSLLPVGMGAPHICLRKMKLSPN